MPKQYVTVRRSCDESYDADAMDHLARTVYEDHEMHDIGLTDSEGNKIMCREARNPIGFVWFRAR